MGLRISRLSFNTEYFSFVLQFCPGVTSKEIKNKS